MKSVSLHRYLIYFLLISFICHISACTKSEKQPDSRAEGQKPVEFYYHESEYKYEPSNFTIDEKIFYKETTLTNSITVNHEYFPKTEHSFVYMGYGGTPAYLNDTGPWIVLDEYSPFHYLLNIHLPNLPDTYIVNIYDNDSNLFRHFIAEKNEVTYEQYTENLYENDDGKELAVIRAILPFYSFDFPAWLSHTKQHFKTEIRTIKGEILFSTYIDYPTIPFRVNGSTGTYFLEYNGELPVYMVLYEASTEDWGKGSGEFPGVGGFPISAFLITPENGYWKGTLNSRKLSGEGDYGLILFKMNPDKPDDYSTPVVDFWAYYLNK
jgi:hypothetical protein